MTRPPLYRYPDDFPEKFIRFHEANFWVYRGMLTEAHALKRDGWRDVGVKYLLEHQRYSPEARERREQDPALLYGINNNFAPWYGRLMEATEPHLEGFLRMRRTEEEIEAADASQITMEFD